jgi:hypothetical protein
MYHSPIVNAAMLAVSTPEAVCAFLKERGKAVADSWLPTTPTHRAKYDLPDDYERTLLARKDRLIDLHLALYGCDRDVVAELFSRDEQDTALRCAALSNETDNQPSLIFSYHTGAEEKLTAFLLKATWDEVTSLFRNEKLDFRFVRSFFERAEEFTRLAPDGMIGAVKALTQNQSFFSYRRTFITHPREKDYQRFLFPEDESAYASAIGALLDLARDMPASPLWAMLLAGLYPRFSLAFCRCDHALMTARRWVEPDKNRSKHETSINEQGHLSDWQLIRFHLGQIALHSRQISVEELRKDSDLALRLAAYAAMDATNENIDSAFDKDGAVCFAAFFENQNLWQSETLRSRLFNLAKTADQRANFDQIMDIRSSVDKFSERLEKEFPDWFVEERFDDTQEEKEATVIAEREARIVFEQQQQQKLLDLAGDLRQVSRRVAVLIGLVVFLVLSYFLA